MSSAAQERFDPELALHPSDIQWSSALQVSWPFEDTPESLPGLKLHQVTKRLADHTILYHQAQRVLFYDDNFKFDFGPGSLCRAATIFHHKAFVRRIPLNPSELHHYHNVFSAAGVIQTWMTFD